MNVGNTLLLSNIFTLGTAQAATSAQVVVALPNGTSQTITSALPPTGVLETVQARYKFLVGGLYQITYLLTLQDGTTLSEVATQWVTWTPCYQTIRQVLGLNVIELPDTALDDVFQLLANEVAQYSPTTELYAVLPTTFRVPFDTGLKWLVASRMRAWSPKKASIGELVYFRKGSTVVQYSGRTEQPKPPEQAWWDQGWQALLAIPSIASTWDQNVSQENTMVAGRGRLDPSNYLSGYNVNVPGAQFPGGRSFSGDFE